VPEAVIFDIDGTILDSIEQHAAAWKEAFQHFGHDFPLEKIRKQIGKGGDQLLPTFLSREEIDEIGEDLTEFRKSLFKKKYLPDVKPFPHVRDLFEVIRAHGQKIALASSAESSELETYERIANVQDLVDAATTSGDVERSKPHPDVFDLAIERLGDGISADNIIAVGDSTYDAQAASKAGLRTVGLSCGASTEQELHASHCVAVYANPKQLWRLYDESPLARKS
jgi:HAD superfamily hydrolase (TIGR01549 family)